MSKALFIFITLVFLSCSSSSKAQTSNSPILTNPTEKVTPGLTLDYLNQFEEKNSTVFQPQNYGTITETGLILNNTEYKILIDSIDSNTLLSMPQMKVENPNLTMPNAIIMDSRPVLPNN